MRDKFGWHRKSPIRLQYSSGFVAINEMPKMLRYFYGSKTSANWQTSVLRKEYSFGQTIMCPTNKYNEGRIFIISDV